MLENREVIKEGDRYICCNCGYDQFKRTGNRLVLMGTSIVEVECGKCKMKQVYRVGNNLGLYM